jgi:hypothetical protein
VEAILLRSLVKVCLEFSFWATAAKYRRRVIVSKPLVLVVLALASTFAAADDPYANSSFLHKWSDVQVLSKAEVQRGAIVGPRVRISGHLLQARERIRGYELLLRPDLSAPNGSKAAMVARLSGQLLFNTAAVEGGDLYQAKGFATALRLEGRERIHLAVLHFAKSDRVIEPCLRVQHPVSPRANTAMACPRELPVSARLI